MEATRWNKRKRTRNQHTTADGTRIGDDVGPSSCATASQGPATSTGSRATTLSQGDDTVKVEIKMEDVIIKEELEIGPTVLQETTLCPLQSPFLADPGACVSQGSLLAREGGRKCDRRRTFDEKYAVLGQKSHGSPLVKLEGSALSDNEDVLVKLEVGEAIETRGDLLIQSNVIAFDSTERHTTSQTCRGIRAKTKSRQAAIVQDSGRTGDRLPLAPLNVEDQQVLAVIEPMDIAGETSLLESSVEIDFQEMGIPDVPEEFSIESPSILTRSPPPIILLQSQTPDIINSQNEQTPSGIRSPAGNAVQSATNSTRPKHHFITKAQRRLQSCVNATELLSEQSIEKIQIKREYMNMKREYYAAKLKIMNENLSVQKEQLNVLRNISKTLSTWKK